MSKSSDTAMAIREENDVLRAIRHEARRECDMYGFDAPDDYERIFEALRYQHYLVAIEPYLKIKNDIAALVVPDIIVSDGGVERRLRYTETEKKMLDDCDNIIRQISLTYGLEDAR